MADIRVCKPNHFTILKNDISVISFSCGTGRCRISEAFSLEIMEFILVFVSQYSLLPQFVSVSSARVIVPEFSSNKTPLVFTTLSMRLRLLDARGLLQ